MLSGILNSDVAINVNIGVAENQAQRKAIGFVKEE